MRMSKMLSRILIPALLLLVICSTSVRAQCIEVERQALLKFKQDMNPKDRNGNDLLPSWGMEGEGEACCKWRGVACSNKSGHVTMLDLSPLSFQAGKISIALAELKHLEYLDLSHIGLNGSHIPSFISSLNKLQYLNLANCRMSGDIPPQIGNLSRLEVLDLGSNLNLTAKSLDWVSGLSSLRKLDLSFADLRKANSCIEMIKNLPNLTSLQLKGCELPKVIDPSKLSLINSSTSLATLDLSGNDLAFPLHRWTLFNFSRFLTRLDLSNSSLVGSIPESIGNMTALKYLNLRDNQLEGSFPISFWNLCELSFLDVSGNNLNGEFPEYTKASSQCSNYSLTQMDVSGNMMTGSLPEAIGKLRELEHLNLSNNSLDGVVSESHFSELSKLARLFLSYNPITLNISSNWTPPFQLFIIGLRNCNLNSEFPKWLSTQTNYWSLDMSSSGIRGPIPNWFWGTVSRSHAIIDLSNNQLSGTINDSDLPSFSGPQIDISSNQLQGFIPRFLFNAGHLYLSKNNFSSLNSLCDVTEDSTLAFLDISHNNLSGELPDCWSHLKKIGALLLGNNRISGNIPVSIGSLTKIESLHLGKNNLSGELPLSLKNFSELSVFDVGENILSGSIPTWLGENMSKVLVLSMRSNHFSGSIPSSLCDLEKLQLLDLSQNKFTSTIPKCIGNLTALKALTFDGTSIRKSYVLGSEGVISQVLEDGVRLTWKGFPSKYTNTLQLLKVLDFSSNKLIGTIPGQITSLVGLVSLNLSRNNLSGKIPSEIGQLGRLDALDSSNNHLSDLIPQSLSQIDRLSSLDLSNNNLSGEIPKGTQLQRQEANAYEGNAELCGFPLPKNCSGEEPTSSIRDNKPEDEDSFITRGFYVSAGIGIVVGFWGFCGTLIFKRSWRYSYFKFFENAQDVVFITAVVSKAKLLRMIKR